MRTHMKRFSLAAGLLAVGLGAVIGLSAIGATMMAGQPTVVVTLNLGPVIDKLDQRADAQTRLEKMNAEMRIEQERRVGEIKKLEAEAKALQDELNAATEPAKKKQIENRMQNLQEQAALTGLNNQAWVTVMSDKIDIESALVMQDLYRSVKTAAAQMASTNRYDVVLVDDSQGELRLDGESRMSRVDQVRQQIASRRMLFVNPVIDITNDLITRMNNEHRTAGPKSAP